MSKMSNVKNPKSQNPKSKIPNNKCLRNLKVITNWGRAGFIGQLMRPVRAPGSPKDAPPPGSPGLQSLVPRPKVKSQKCQKNPKCQKHQKKFF